MKNDNKKKRIIISVILAIVIIAILLLLRSCTKKKVEVPVVNEPVTSSEVVNDDKGKEEVQEETTVQEVTTIVQDDKASTKLSYFVNFLNIDGSTLQRTTIEKGNMPSYLGKTPTYEDGAYAYTFTGWDKKLTTVNSTQTYIAQYSKVKLKQKDNVITNDPCVHTSYTIQNDGSWTCSKCGALLADTDDAYFTVLSSGQPSDIIKLTEENVTLTSGIKKIGDNISYENSSTAQDVVIRTDGGTLYVDDSTASSIKHYGESIFLDIKQCATSSYHEFGYIPQAQISKGRIVNEVYKENEEGVQDLFLIAASTTSFDEIVVGAAENAKLPKLDRTDVNIAANGTLVVKTETPSEKKYVYLYKAGIEEQIVIKSTKTDITQEDVKGLEGASSQDVKEAAKELANIVKRNEQGKPVDSNNEVINLDAADADTKLVKSEVKANADDISKGSTLFSGGTGTINNPYLISCEEELTSIKEIYGDTNDSYGVSKNADKHYYFKQIDDIVLTKNGPAFAGSYDGGNFKVTSTINTGKYFRMFSGTSGDVDIKNLNIYEPKNGLIVLVWIAFNSDSLNFENINFYNEIGSDVCNHSNTNSGLLCMNDLSSNTRTNADTRIVTAKNIVNRANIYSSGTCGAIFFAKTIAGGSEACLTKLRMYDCINYGDFTAQSWAGVIDGNSGYSTNFSQYPNAYQEYFVSDDTLKELVYLENVKNYGTISSKENSDYQMNCFVTCGNTNNHLFARLNKIYKDDVGGTFIKIASITGIGKVYYDSGIISLESTNQDISSYKVMLHIGNINTVSGYYSNSTTIVLDASLGTGTVELKDLNTFVYDANTAKVKGIDADNLEYNIPLVNFGVNASLFQEGSNLYLIIQNGGMIQPTESSISGIVVIGYDANGNSVGTYSVN